MRQRFLRLWLTLTLVALGTWALAAPAALGAVKFSTTLTGAAEAPGPGDPAGTGTFTARINIGQGTLCYTLTFSGIGDPTGAHIHFAPVGEPGDVVIPLDPAAEPDTCIDVDRELLKAIQKSPELYYVNVHTAEFPAGAIRGQLG